MSDDSKVVPINQAEARTATETGLPVEFTVKCRREEGTGYYMAKVDGRGGVAAARTPGDALREIARAIDS